MKAITILSIAALSLLSNSFAAGPKGPKVPTTISCAVMSTNKVNIADATKKKSYTDYKGRRYFFCCGDCPSAFKANPAKYAKSASIATPKAATK